MSGHTDDPRAGHPYGHPDGDSAEMPADLAAVQADDLLLDMLGSTGRPPGGVGDVDSELTRVLAAWRSEVQADSNRALVDTDTALAVISAARRPTRRRNPVFGPMAAAAAVFVIAFSAMGLLAKSAQPGDNLWGVTEVLYSDYARSVETAASVRIEIEQVKKALKEKNPEQAKTSLDRIKDQLPKIAPAEGKADLTTQHHQLEQALVTSPPVPVVPPGPSDPGSSDPRRVPLVPSPPATTPSPSPDRTPPAPSPSPEPSPEPSPSPEPTPSPSPEDPNPVQPTQPPIPSPATPTPPGPEEQPGQPSARPIHTSPSDFIRPSRPAPPEPPKPPSRPSTDRAPSGSGGPVPPARPRAA